MFLIIQCSMIKSKLPSGQAQEIYRGQVVILGLKFARKYNLDVYILSAKYGLIRPTDIIENYNLKAAGYVGPWPEGKGYWLGGKGYFKHAPKNIEPLIPNNRGYGDMKNWLGKHINAI